MDMFVRQQYSILKERLEEPRKFIQVVSGPRQVGKSTLVTQVMNDVTVPYDMENADGIDATDGAWIGRVWQSVRMTMQLRQEPEHILVIDEVQKLNNWSEIVKREWDYDTLHGINIKVILLGSSRLLTRKGLTESLAGRYELIRIGHWSFAEMNTAFGYSLEQYIYYGGYPGPASMINDERRWKRYIKDSLVAPAIEKDVIMTSNIYKPALMKQVFELGCAYSSELLSLSKMVGQLQDAGNVTTIANYIDILRQCELLCGLQKYSVDNARRYNSVPKFQVFNNALLTAYKGRSFEKDCTDTKVWGRWVESAVGAHLISRADELGYSVYYWRERNDEVDFVVTCQDKCYAIEVKSGRRSMNSGLPAFNVKFSPTSAFVVGTQGVSLYDFLTSDLENLFG